MQEKKSPTASFLGSQRGFPPLAAVRFAAADDFPPVFSPRVALKIKEALSTNILVTSSADFVLVAYARSVI